MLTDLRKLLWLYLILLIFEGALRKWVVPQLDMVLLICRDPLVVWIYFLAMQRGYRFSQPICIFTLILAVATGLVSLLFGQGGPLNAFITIYGLRTDYLQIPLIFLIPQILHRDDVLAMGKFLLYCAIAMAPLAVLQFKSPVGSWINLGALPTHYGTVRTTGTFSFGTGLSSFYALSSVFVFYGFLEARTYKVWLIVAVTLATLLASACAGSRSGLVFIGIVAAVAILCVITRGKGGIGLLVGGAIVAIAMAIVSHTSIGQEGSDQLTKRFSDASRAGEGGAGGFIMRFVDTITGPFTQTAEVPFLGYGLGLGTNAGLALYHPASNSKEVYWPEIEWERLLFESGPLLGTFVIIFRVALTVTIGMQVFRAYRQDNILPALLFAACGILIFNGQWGVPTTLGFAMFVGGLTLAACEVPEEHWEDDEYEHEEHEGDEEHDHEHDEDHDHDDAGEEPDHPHPADRVS